jgi:hypothetical protein
MSDTVFCLRLQEEPTQLAQLTELVPVSENIIQSQKFCVLNKKTERQVLSRIFIGTFMRLFFTQKVKLALFPFRDTSTLKIKQLLVTFDFRKR